MYTGRQVDDARARLLVSGGLSQLALLSQVDMSFNVISDVGARAVAALISRSDTLTTVILVDNNIRAAGARALAYGLAADTCPLQSLDLRLNYVGDEGALELYRVLTVRNRTLTKINVSSNLCTAASTAALADMLRHNNIISTVDVACNNLAVSITCALSLSLSLSLSVYLCVFNPLTCFQLQSIQRVQIARNADSCASRRILSVRLSVIFRCFVQKNEDTIVRFSASHRAIISVSRKVKFIRIFAGDHPQRGR